MRLEIIQLAPSTKVSSAVSYIVHGKCMSLEEVISWEVISVNGNKKDSV
jgi:hypothetical protein